MDIPPDLLRPPAEVRQLDGACTREEPCWKNDVVDHREPEHGPGPGADLVGAAVLTMTAEATHLEDAASPGART